MAGWLSAVQVQMVRPFSEAKVSAMLLWCAPALLAKMPFWCTAVLSLSWVGVLTETAMWRTGALCLRKACWRLKAGPFLQVEVIFSSMTEPISTPGSETTRRLEAG